MTDERIRKDDIKKGVRTQTMFTFRIDNDLLEKLRVRTNNKGRYINEVLRKDLE